jgi:hypothetical protein
MVEQFIIMEDNDIPL